MPVQETNDNKLEAFLGSMQAEALLQSKKILDELKQREKLLLDKAQKDIGAEAERYRAAKFAEIRARESYRVNQRMTDNKRKLLQFRADCANDTLETVTGMIAEFTASEAYLPQLKKLLKQAVDAFGYGFSAEVSLRPEDMHFADELALSVTGVSLAFTEGDFKLGGLCFYCPSKGKRVDMSFDEALGGLMGHFAEFTGIRVDE